MESESQDLLILWNQTQTDYPRDASIQELFELQVKRTPEAVAMVFKDQQQTYNQLNERANQLAHHLSSLGVKKGSLVAVYIERSLEMVLSMMGILKAGGAYVPLDVSYPAQRLSFMLQDTKADVLLTREDLLDRFSSEGIQVVCLDRDADLIGSQLVSDPKPEVCGDDLAYVIYTSGSTGTPKGVEVLHRGIVRLVYNTDYIKLGAENRIAHISNCSFDASTFEVWGALLSGARLVVLEQETVLSPRMLADRLQSEGINVLFLTTALFNLLAKESSRVLADVGHLLFGGEAADPRWVRKVVDENGPGRLLHVYGPTENTTFTTWHEVSSVPDEAVTVPIGRPIANTKVYVLDNQMEPVPIGVSGDLYIGGDGLARGYFNRPELTAERFVNDPFVEGSDSRLYRTGDVVRWLPEGVLEFLGRKDDQVKLRGFRIELGEIESVLRNHESVEESVVLLRADDPGDKRLVSYVVSREDVSLSVEDLRTYLKQKLPDYMVPSHFVLMESLPLTPNGKVDRKTLPAPDRSLLERDEGFVAPITSMEKLLAEIWEEVLRVKRIGTKDNFLMLGGHSLHAVQIIARILDRLQIDLPLHLIFESANLRELAGYLEQQVSNKKEAHLSSIQPIDRNNPLPVSFSQERVYFIQQLDPENIAYNFQVIMRFEGNLNVHALERTLYEIIKRHEIYRTTFSSLKDGHVVQNVHDPFPIKLPVVDLRSLTEAEQDKEVQWIIDQETRKPFDVSKLFLIRWVLIWLKDSEYKLIHVEHHLVHDGWSFNVFLDEFSKLYESFCAGKDSPLPDLPVQFADFAHWQRQWMQGDVAEKQLAYWKTKLTGCPPLLKLPYDHSRPLRQTFHGAAIRKQIPSDLYQAILDHNRKTNTTLFMTLFSAFVILLHRYSGQYDICVGVGMANRHLKETEGLIGMIINNVVLRTDLSEDPIVQELLEKVRDISLEACTNQDLPFERVVEALHPERNLSYNPLFQVIFGLHDSPMPKVDLPGLNGSFELALNNGSSKFDLNVIIFPNSYQHFGRHNEEDEGLTMVWEYNKDLFEGGTTERMIHHYFIILEQIISKQNHRISKLLFLTEQERQKLIVTWNQTQADYSRDACIHQLFESQAQSDPNAVAIVFNDQQMTYGQLNERANQLAHWLIKQDIGPDCLVGLCMNRSPDVIIAMLGILKAGGAYVPLDPGYPAEFLSFMVEDTRLPVLLTQASLVERLTDHGAKVFCLDTQWPELEGSSTMNPPPRAKAENLAYVMYTSGSTGRPKGVEVPHRGVVRLLFGADYVHLGPEETLLQLASISFDASTFEIWGALLHGGRCVMFPSQVPGPEELGKVTDRYGVSTLWLTSSLFNMIISDSPQSLKGIKQLLTGGEALSVPHIRKALEHLPSTRLINGYGPTEGTTFTCCYPIPRQLPESISSIPIGRPIANTQVYVLDSHMEPVPVGVPGELYIGGDGLARGYLNRPDLTAERFVDDPFIEKPDSEGPGQRLYRTGDMVRWLPEGILEFLGRKDDQVKLRGFRVELGEIESVLSAHESVREAVVLLREDEPGDKHLVGYIVPSEKEPVSFDDLRAYLKKRLPDYMAPSYFVQLESLLLTPNGKVDKRALPAPDQSMYLSGDLSGQFVGPRTPMEQTLVNIWLDVLGRSGALGRNSIGIHDNFFYLGGHSLLATQVISRVNETFSVSLPVAALFEHPTVDEFGKELESRMRQEGLQQGQQIKPVERRKEMPLSFAQQRLWFISQLEPDSPLYNIPIAIELKGLLDLEALQKSLNELIKRHEPLRSRFQMNDGQPVQLIDAPWCMNIPVADLSKIPDLDQQAEANNIIKEESLRPFDLASGPLLRVKLLSITEADQILILTMHHIVSDGWSMGILFHELAALYESYIKGRPSPLPELAVQSADFAVWQRKWLSEEVLDSQLSYWREKLSGKIPVLNLPIDYPMPAIQTFNGARHSIQLSRELSESLKALSHSEHVTLFMSLLSAFKVLLYRYTGQEDIVVGSPVANRNRADIESLIGFFINMLVLRSRLSGKQSFLDLLARIRETTLGAYMHQDLPFEKLVEEFEPDRDLSRSPLFQVTFVLQNAPMEPLSMAGLQLKPISMECQTTRFDLEVHVWEQNGHLKVIFIYNRDLFAPSTIERMMNHYQELLQGIVSNPEQRISELPLMSQQKRQELLEVWGRTQAGYPRNAYIDELFESQVQRNPDAVAIVFKDQQLTYGQLNERANQLAHHLRSLGIKKGSMVAVCLERSIEMVVSMLGILKAGGAYVPLDVSYPAQRISFMLQDTGSNVLLTCEDLLDRFSDEDVQLVCLDRDKDLINTQPVLDPETETCGDDLAYVMYTSGSTGTPKGVEVLHRGIVRLVCNTDYIQLGEADRVAHISNCSFDASTFEVWGALLSGARLVILDQKTVLSPRMLADNLKSEGINVLFLTTALFNLLAKESPEVLAGIGHLLFGGEAVDPQWVRRMLGKKETGRLLHVYGPTENTTFTTWYEITSVPDEAMTVPIGRPIANTRVYVLDSNMEPVPAGVPGELFIGGDGLARGYLNRPELTAERFVDDPFSEKPVSEEPGPRLYRTGDMVRWLPEGILEFLGRKDDQVKLRGFRIELGEIESVLSAHESVEETVVLLREDEPGDKHLVGYIVPSEKDPVSFDDIRTYLKKRLPDYMAPSYFVQLESLPLTPNGKVDKRALPAPDQSMYLSGDLSGQFVEPRTPMEQALVKIWSDVLGRSHVFGKNGIGIHDNFFYLGGHSLLATQVISRVNEAFGVSLPVAALFEHPTVDEFGKELESKMRQEGLQQGLQIKPVERKKEMPLSFAQQRLWFISQLEPDSPSYNMPIVLRLKGKLDTPALQHSLDELCRRHESLRTIFTSVEGQPKQCIMRPQPFELVKEDLNLLPADLRESKARQKVEHEALRPFDLAKGPLVRGRLLQLDEHTHIMVLCMHHIIFDGWSMRLFFNELATLYTSFSSGRPSPLPDLPIQYADFAQWQRNHLQGQLMQHEFEYWKQQLGDNPPPLEFPTDRPRPAIQTYKGACESIKIEGPQLKNLRELSHSEEATLFMTMIASFKALLYRYTGQKDILVGIPIAGRNRQEIEGLIGFFVNTLVLRTDLSGLPSFRALLRRIRNTALEVYQHQEMPFEKLVEKLHPERDLSRNPLFQVFFNMVDLKETKITLPPLDVEPMPLPLNIAKFDLTVYCFDYGDALSLCIDYSTDLFQAGTIKRLLSHYQTLLTSFIEDPDRSISVAPLFSEKEHTKLKTSCNEISPTNPFQEFKRIEIEQTITERFLEQAKKYPERIAIKTTDEEWTYQRLDIESDRIAHIVDSRILTDCQHVALLFDHSVFTSAAMLGVLKTGRAYVPLDISYPRSRLEYIIKDSLAGAIITNGTCMGLANTLSDGVLPLINVDKPEGDTGPVVQSAKPDSLAYILYTSGSTGQPKGVMQNHRNVLHHIRVYGNSLHIVPEDRLTFLTSYTFDGAVMDIYGALLNGATLYPYNIRERGLTALPYWLDSEQVTIYHSTPSVYRYFIGMLNKDQVLLHLRLVVLGGEEVLRSDMELYRKHFTPHSLFVNGLGPSESTLALQYFMNKDSAIDRPSIPAGYPVADTEIMLIDEKGEEVDLYGEIGIRSAHVALGYWRRPELTQTAFLTDTAHSSRYIYRTGDMGRMLPDGSIEFAGRKDLQVKIRGMRIELGEINMALTQHPAVHQAVTLALDDGKGGKQLVSYVIPSYSSKPSAKELRDYLRQRLADYMIPSAFMVLETLPLTPNGKIDYRALPEPLKMESETAYVAPRNDVERQLVEIWTNLLQIERIGIHDNFFQLGGQSLLATQVMARIQKVLGVELPLRSLFQAPTVADLAAAVKEVRIAGPARRIPAIDNVSREARRINLPSQKIRKNSDALKDTINEGGEE